MNSFSVWIFDSIVLVIGDSGIQMGSLFLGWYLSSVGDVGCSVDGSDRSGDDA